MTLQHILDSLTKVHYQEQIHYHVFDRNHKKTNNIEYRTVSNLFTEQEWESGITLLHRLKIQENDHLFNNLWTLFLVDVNANIDQWVPNVSHNIQNIEKYLKRILVILGHGEEVAKLQEEGKAMSQIIQIIQKNELLGKNPDAIHIADTIRCYGNWWRHGYEKVPGVENEIPDTSELPAMIILDLKGEVNDFKILSEQVRISLVLLLFIMKSNQEQLNRRIQVNTVTTEVEQFNQSKFLDLYFSNLQKHIDLELNTQAIEELKTDNDFGYFEHTLRFSHCTEASSDWSDNEDDENRSQQRFKLSQFRKNLEFKTNIILGMPGAGKTTALYLLIKECIHQYSKKSKGEENDSIPVPVFIPLRSVCSRPNEDPIIGAINQEVGYRIIEKSVKYREAAFKFIYDMVKEGRALLFFDGLNEISQDDAKIIIPSLKNFIETLPEESHIFITGRKYEYESSFYFNEFNKVTSVGIWHLEELSFDQIESYLTPQVCSHIINGGIVELFSSPLNLRLFLNYINKSQSSAVDDSLEIPLNRGEILDAFLENTLKDIKDKNNKSCLFHANNLLKHLATIDHGRVWDISAVKGYIENMPEGLIDRLAAAKILTIIPAQADHDEQISFSIDTFQEFYRAKDIIDRLYEDTGLSLYSLKDQDKKIGLNPESSEDFETLKLIFEIGSSPQCYHKRKNGTIESSRKHAAAFSARLAKDFLNPEQTLSGATPTEELCNTSKFGSSMNPRFLTLCRLTRNIPFTEDKDIDEKVTMNAKDIAELMAINNLRWFRIKHPQPIVISKRDRTHLLLMDMMAAAAIIGGGNIWNEIISTYWLFTFGILSPHDYNCDDTLGDKLCRENSNPKNKLIARMSSAYTVLYALASNCRDYISLYDRLHNLHLHLITRRRNNSSSGINSFLYQYFLCFQPNYVKKHLFHHLSKMYEQRPNDLQLLSDINTILCHSGDSQLLAENFRFDSKGKIRIKELRSILCNFADSVTQKFVLSERFFKMLQTKYKDEYLSAMTIRHFLFRIGLTPTMRDFLFKQGGLNMLPQEEVEGIMDMIPLHSIPKDYIEKHYDNDICSLLIKEREEETTGCRIGYTYFGKKDGNFLVSINDIEEKLLTGDTCRIGTEGFTIINDSYEDTARLYCKIKAADQQMTLLPESGYICSEDDAQKIPYQAASSNIELDFYLYGKDAISLYAISKGNTKVYIEGRECKMEFPEIDMKKPPVYRLFRILEISPSNDKASLPYSGELTFSKQIDKATRPKAVYNSPERYKYLSNNLNLKVDQLKFQVFGQNKSFLWAITEKVVTSADLLTGCNAIDKNTGECFQICSIKPNKAQYVEFWFKVSQRISIPSYGKFSLLDEKGEYNHIPFCFSLKSEDNLSFMLRVAYEDIPEGSAADLYNVSYLLGNIPLQLVSVEKINPNRRYSIWTLKKEGRNYASSSGEFYVQRKDENGINKKFTITLSGETHTTIKHISCELASYDSTSGRVTFIARSSKGKIGAGTGDINLLKGLFLCSTQDSSARFLIEKDSEMTPLWIRRMYIRFNITPEGKSGHFMINGSKICFVSKENNYVLWCDSNSNVPAELDLKKNQVIELIFDNGSQKELRIMEINPGEKTADNSMIIQSHCCEEFSELMKKENFEFNLQNFVPVQNQPNFPRVFKGLYHTYSVRYTRDVKKDGAIIISKPITAVNADSVTLDGKLSWKIKETCELGDKLLNIELTDDAGRTPKLINSNGIVTFQINSKDTPLWYASLTELIDRNHPEKYHADICDKLMDEMVAGEHYLDQSTLNFFIQKSRAYNLATNDNILSDIEALPESKLDICRVLLTDPLKGLEAYSLLKKKNVPSGDTMPESHGGREFQWTDLVLMERNHKLTLINDLPRYRCLGYKDGFILSVSEADKYGRKMLIIISFDKEERAYSYFYDPHKDTREFTIGDHVNFFATVNYKDIKKPAAENVVLTGRKQPIFEAEYMDCRSDVYHKIYSFNRNGARITIKLNVNATAKINLYDSMLVHGQTYKMFQGAEKYYLAL